MTPNNINYSKKNLKKATLCHKVTKLQQEKRIKSKKNIMMIFHSINLLQKNPKMMKFSKTPNLKYPTKLHSWQSVSQENLKGKFLKILVIPLMSPSFNLIIITILIKNCKYIEGVENLLLEKIQCWVKQMN